MGMTQKKKVLLAELALLFAGIIWGSGFVVMKNSLSSLPVNYLLAFRFTIATVILAIVLMKKIPAIGKKTLGAGAVCGVLMYAAYSVQTYGLSYTTSGKNAFLTAVYVVIVPFLYWAIYRQKPSKRNVVAAALCLLGVGFVALDAEFSVNIGDVLTLLGGVIYALHIVAVCSFTERGEDVMVLTLLQFAFSGLCAWMVAAIAEPFPAAALQDANCVGSLLYLGLICTLVALTLQNVGLKYAPPAHASLLMSTEAPFGCLFGILLLNEEFTLKFAVGFLLIFGSIVISELGNRNPEPAPEPAP